MAGVAVDVALEQHGPLAAAGVLDGALHGLVDGQHVGAVHDDALNAVALCALRQRGGGAGGVDVGGDGELVVLDEIDDGELPDGRHIDALMEAALVGCAVAEERNGHRTVVVDLGCQRRAGGQRNAAADDAVRAEQAALDLRDVHGAAAAVAEATLLAVELRERVLQIVALHDAVAVAAVAGRDIVGGLEGHVGAHDGAFFAEADVDVALDLTLEAALHGALLKFADLPKVFQHLQKEFLFIGCHCITS